MSFRSASRHFFSSCCFSGFSSPVSRPVSHCFPSGGPALRRWCEALRVVPRKRKARPARWPRDRFFYPCRRMWRTRTHTKGTEREERSHRATPVVTAITAASASATALLRDQRVARMGDSSGGRTGCRSRMLLVVPLPPTPACGPRCAAPSGAATDPGRFGAAYGPREH